MATESEEPTPLLSVRAFTKNYGGVQALAGADLEILPGEIHALLGENGAGKSTLIKIVSGVVHRDSGTILWRGTPARLATPAEAQRLGIRVIHQHLSIVEHLSVADNLTLGTEQIHFGFIDREEGRRRTLAALGQLGHPLELDRRAGSLKVAERQILEIARAISTDARLIVMDEPTASLGTEEVDRLFDVMRTLRTRSIGIIFISHRLEEILGIADRVTVLRDGRTVGTMPTTEASRDSLISLMVGRTLGRKISRPGTTKGRVVLEVDHLSTESGLSDISLRLHLGEILGVYGLLGSGRTELARALFGADPVERGTVRLDGERISIQAPSDATRLGLGLVPEERGSQALFPRLSVVENVVVAAGDLISRHGWISSARERALAHRVVDDLHVVTPSIDQPAGSLSGGNQQKLVVGRWLVRGSRILLLDDPTVGVDVGAKDEIYRIITDVTASGTAVILFSSELPELLGLSDRLIVLHEGQVAGTLERSGLDPKTVVALAVGGAAT